MEKPAIIVVLLTERLQEAVIRYNIVSLLA